MNVDEMCNPLSSGQLEVSHSDLVLHQRGKTPVRWPLRCLRRYGCDAKLFSFECGRRCATGPGVYAFQCARAETLFNLLQTRVQVHFNVYSGIYDLCSTLNTSWFWNQRVDKKLDIHTGINSKIAEAFLQFYLTWINITRKSAVYTQ